jgi:tight adherence protein C
LLKKTQARKLRITWGLADAMDLMVVAVEAGLVLNAALNRIGEELKDLHPDMHYEIDIVNLEIRVGRSREEALRNLAERTGVDDIRSFRGFVDPGRSFRSSIAKAVRGVFAESYARSAVSARTGCGQGRFETLVSADVFLFPVIILIVLAPSLFALSDLLFN